MAIPKYLLIAEKPSLMREIQSCVSRHRDQVRQKVGEVDFIALSGHVCGYWEPNDFPQWKGVKWSQIPYPMVPEQWPVKALPEAGKKETLKRIRDRVGDYDGIIVATDSDVEGYGIYFLLEQYLHLEHKPALRFVEHSLTDSEILSSLLTMTDLHQDPVHTRATQSFLIRSRADWLFGMNASRIMTNKAGTLLKVGRVKAPTIKLVYDNSMAIANFRKEKYYVATADYGTFQAVGSDGKDAPIRYKTPEEIGSYPLEGQVVYAQSKREFLHAPKLFDLTSLQAEAGRAFGYTPERTLELVQSLYEKHKVISYPRTQCRCVSSEKAKEFPMMLGHMKAFPDLEALLPQVTRERMEEVCRDSQVVNDAEVAKESHDALLPTAQRADPEQMTQEERNVCHMIYARLLSQFLPPAADDRTKVRICHGEGIFVATGKVVVEQGWRRLFSQGKDSFLPPLREGQQLRAEKIGPVEKTTTPPKRLTQATLINAMQNIAGQISDKELRRYLAESKGIGTPATRAGIIADILKTGYIEDKKGGLFITDLGVTYIESLEGMDIVSPEFAAVMEQDIKRVQRGEAEGDAVYRSTLEKLNAMCARMLALPERRDPAGDGQPRKVSPDLHCPVCGSGLVETRPCYLCAARCGFSFPKTVGGTAVTEEMLGTILSGKPTRPVTVKKKDGTSFQARIVLTPEHKLGFDFSSGITCPRCGKENITLNRGGVFCDCGFKLYRKQFGAELTDHDLATLVQKGKTRKLKAHSQKTGKDYYIHVLLAPDGTTSQEFVKTPQKGKEGASSRQQK